MTFYQKELERIKKVIYKNQDQINAAIAVRNYIDCNYESDLNLELLAKIQLISKYHLLRLFKKYYGLTPRQYLINKRIEISKENLKKGMTVTATCFAVGFESPGSFSTLFKTKNRKNTSSISKRATFKKFASIRFLIFGPHL